MDDAEGMRNAVGGNGREVGMTDLVTMVGALCYLPNTTHVEKSIDIAMCERRGMPACSLVSL